MRVNRSSEEEELRQKAHLGWAGGGAGGGAEIVNQAFRDSHVVFFRPLLILKRLLALRFDVSMSSLRTINMRYRCRAPATTEGFNTAKGN